MLCKSGWANYRLPCLQLKVQVWQGASSETGRKARGRGGKKCQDGEGLCISGLTNEQEEEAAHQEEGRMEVRVGCARVFMGPCVTQELTAWHLCMAFIFLNLLRGSRIPILLTGWQAIGQAHKGNWTLSIKARQIRKRAKVRVGENQN